MGRLSLWKARRRFVEIQRIWHGLQERPLPTIASILVMFLLFHLPMDAATHWINEEISELFHISKPSMPQVINFFLSWGLPFIGAAAIMVAYHAGHPLPVTSGAGENPSAQPPRRRVTSLELWYLAAIGLAVFTVGEILLNRSAPIELSNVLFDRVSELEKKSLGQPGAKGEQGPPGPQGERGIPGPPGASADPNVAHQLSELAIAQNKLRDALIPALLIVRLTQIETEKPKLDAFKAQVETIKGAQSGGIRGPFYGVGSLSPLMRVLCPSLSDDVNQEPSELDVRTYTVPRDETYNEEAAKFSYRRIIRKKNLILLAIEKCVRSLDQETAQIKQQIASHPVPKP